MPVAVCCVTTVYFRMSKTVYRVEGKTGWFAVSVNGKQNSGLFYFIPESRLPFLQISSIYCEKAAKALDWYQRYLWRNGTRISVWNIPSGKTGMNDEWMNDRKNDSKVRVPYTFQPDFPERLFVNGKQPISSVTIGFNFDKLSRLLRLLVALFSRAAFQEVSSLQMITP